MNEYVVYNLYMIQCPVVPLPLQIYTYIRGIGFLLQWYSSFGKNWLLPLRTREKKRWTRKTNLKTQTYSFKLKTYIFSRP